MNNDKKVEEFWNWYRKVSEHKENKFDEELYLGLKEIHSVSNVIKAVGFFEIMKYLIEKKNVFKRPNNKPEWTEEDYKAREKEIILLYYHAYDQMIAHEVTGINENYLIDMAYVKDGGYYDVSMCERYKEGRSWMDSDYKKYGLDGIPWNEVMGYTIIPVIINTTSPVTVAAELVWELTFYTYDELDFELKNFDEGSDEYKSLLEKREQIDKEMDIFANSEKANDIVKKVYENIKNH